MKPTIHIQHYQSPCGELLLGSYEGKICLCDWATRKRRKAIDDRLRRLLDSNFVEEDDNVLVLSRQQLDEYFYQERCDFDIPILRAGSEFQQRVWNVLSLIPYGTVVSYAEIAHRANVETSVRAVANAIGANAISIFIPCHRVIGKNGSLTGYAGGLAAKQHLLALEHGSGRASENSFSRPNQSHVHPCKQGSLSE